jgi:hypothetical protein
MKILAIIGFIGFTLVLLTIFAAVLVSSHIDEVDED